MCSDISTIFQQSVVKWCQDNSDTLERIESTPCASALFEDLFDTLSELGVLDLPYQIDDSEYLPLLSEIVFSIARYSASLAVVVMQQNLAANLLMHGGHGAPQSWVALPLYDGPLEWPYRLRAYGDAVAGNWLSIPMLPIARTVLLPLFVEAQKRVDKDGALPTSAPVNFKLIQLSINIPDRPILKTHPVASVKISESVKQLGLRGCPVADIEIADYSISESKLILSGQASFQRCEKSWLQMEVACMAIRSGLLESSYNNAHTYAKQRWQGGKFIIEHSLVQRMLAKFYLEKCSQESKWRSMVALMAHCDKMERAAQLSWALESGMQAAWSASDGIQLLGGIGYTEDYPQARHFRDAKQCEFLLGHPQAKSFSAWHEAIM